MNHNFTGDKRPSRENSLLLWIPLLLVISVHVFFLGKHFGGVTKIFSDEPLVYSDHGGHFYYATIGSRFFINHGRFWGYDPFLMAGAPTDLADSSDRFIKLMMGCFYFVPPEISYKVIVFLMGALLPLMLYWSGRLWDMNRQTALLACITGSWLWFVGGGLDFLMKASAGFMLASIFGIWLSGFFFQFFKSPARASAAGILAGSPLALLIHPGVLPIIVCLAGTFYLFYFKTLTRKTHVFIVATALLSLLVNLFWIVPNLYNLQFADPPGSLLGLQLILVTFVEEVIQKHQYFLILLLPVAGEGLRYLSQTGKKELAAGFGAGLLGLLLLTFAGGLLPVIKEFQLIRYIFPFVMLSTFPVSIGIISYIRKIRSPGLGAKHRLPAALSIIIFIFSLGAFLWDQNNLPLNTSFIGLNNRTKSIIEWTKANTDAGARILIEDNGPWGEINCLGMKLHALTRPYGDNNPLSAVAYYTKRELIGGPHWLMFLKNHHADFSGTELLGKRFDGWDRDAIIQAMDLYNIGWVIAFSPWFHDLFDRFPDLFQPLKKENGFTFYKVKRRHSFILNGGSGLVCADYNKIHITGADPDIGQMVISYHWHPRLKIEPESCRLVRVFIGDDPVGFIGIKNIAAEMVIENDYCN